MAFDGMMTYAITAELQNQLQSGKITKIYQPYPRDLLFQIRAQGRTHKLMISANPTFPRIHLTQASYDNPQEAPMFCMLLRKHLEGGIIEEIKQLETERIIHIQIRSRDELGDTSYKRLIIEIMGKHSNIILLDSQRKMILDSIHHVTQAVNQHRVLLPGREYIAPPDQGKLNPFLVDKELFIKKIQFNAGKLDQQMVEQFSGISPLLAKEILFQAGLPERENVVQSFLRIMKQMMEKKYEPVIMQQENKEFFYLFPLTHLQAEVKSFASVSEMLERFFHGKAERDRVKQRAHDFFKFLSTEKAKNEKKIKKLIQSKADSEKADRYKLMGELLTAYLHQIKRGDREADVLNYYDPQGSRVTIPLDPSLTPNENAQLYFKKYNKAKKSIQFLEQQIVLAQQEVSYFETLLQQLEHASPKDVEEIREELVEGGYLRNRIRGRQNKKKKELKPEFEQFFASDGTQILVGKNNKQNEYLTNRLARSSDTWLHTKDIPGSHVIIRQNQVTEETLLEAAKLAAYFSKARGSSQVPVDYTLVKHVKKPNGSKPGFVIYDQHKTVYVTPSEEQVDQLRPKQGGRR